MDEQTRKRRLVAGQIGKSGGDLYAHVKQHLRHVSSQPKQPDPQPPIIQHLREAKSKLKPITEMTVPHIPSVSIIRDGKHAVHKTGTDFLEFAMRAKRDLTLLSATESGQKIFKTIQDSGHNVKIQDRGYNVEHGGSHKALDKKGAKTPGVGSDSVVTHQTDRSILNPRPHAAPTSSVISLGHELVHSTHSATGVLQEGKHDKHHVSPKVKKEERATVGAPDGSGGTNGLPTENSLRIDLAKQHQGITPQSDGNSIPRVKYGKRNLNFE